MKKRIAFGFALGLIVLGCAGSGESRDVQYGQSLLRMKALGLGVLMYAGDYDDTLPLSGKWMDGVKPYVANDDTLFHSPAVKQGYGYALNSDTAGLSLSSFSDPDGTPMVFDSTETAYNATASIDTMPNPPRYGGRNTVYLVSGRLQDEEQIPGYSSFATSKDHLKHVAVGLLMYANDCDDHLPLGSSWMDGIRPYIKFEHYLRSPAVNAKDPTAYGYALNVEVAAENLNHFPAPTTTIAVFDSTNLAKNACEPTSTLPNPPRYPEGNTIGYLDGHVAQPPVNP